MSGDAPPPVVIGLDAGGTRTRGIAVDAHGVVVARAEGSGANPRTLGDEHGHAQIREIVDALRGAARRPVAHLMLGSAGLLDAAPEATCAAWARALDVAVATVDSDVRIAHAAAFGSEPGVMSVAGTGSQALAIDPSGRRVSIGGWGPLFGDEGSAFWIASTAIRGALLALDERRSSPIAEALLAYAEVPATAATGERNARLLDVLYGVHGAARGGPAAHARFAPVIAELADGGDVESQALLQRAGRLLAETAELAARTSGVRRIACAGSVLEHNGFVSRAFDCALQGFDLERVAGGCEPVMGAVYLAMAAAGWDRGAALGAS